MELKQFIKEALLNITEGVKEANKSSDRFKIMGEKHHDSGMEGTYVNFDVSIVVNEESSDEAGGKIGAKILSVFSADVGSKIEQASSYQNAHRVTFKIYISEK